MTKKTFVLRDYQVEVINKAYTMLSCGFLSVLLYLPTGAGKTIVAAQMCIDAVTHGRRVLFVVHRSTLLEQTRQTIKEVFGIEGEVISAKNNCQNSSAPVLVAMINTLQNQELPPDLGLVILDECHTTSYYQAAQALFPQNSLAKKSQSNYYLIGLTATPFRRLKREGFCKYFDAKILGPSLEELIRKGVLVLPRYFTFDGLIDFSQLDPNPFYLEDEEEEYNPVSLNLFWSDKYNSDVVERVLEKAPNRQAIAFCGTVEQAKNLSKKFSEKGRKAQIISGETSPKKRQTIIESFQQKETKILVSCQALIEGFNETSVDCVILARPTKSYAFLVQMCGRGLRSYPNKTDSLMLDFGENFKRIGFLDDDKILGDFCPTSNYKPKNFSSNEEPPEKKTPEEYYPLPKLGENLSPKQEARLFQLRQETFTAFITGINPENAHYSFYKDLGYYPPTDWLGGAIFSTSNTLININDVAVYQAFLVKLRPKAPASWYELMLEFEFGKSVDSSLIEAAKNWSQILGVNQDSDWKTILDVYTQKNSSPRFKEILKV